MPVWIGSNAVVAQRVRLNCRYPAFHAPRVVAVGDLHARERAGQRPCCIWSNMRRFAIHPFADGNSRSQRVLFTRYLNAAGWDVDWMAINASAVHAARHVAMATVDSSYLAAELRPGIVPIGSAAPGSLARTQGRRDARTSVHLYDAMRAHKRAGLPTATFRAQTAAAGPLSTGSDQPPAGRGRTQAPPRSLRPGSVSSQPSPRRGQGR